MTGWPQVVLGDLCTVTAGGTPSRTDPENFGGGIPWVKIGDMSGGRVSRTEETISAKGLASSSAKLLPPQTLLLSIFATVGRTAVLEVEAATNQAIVGITPRDSRILDSTFLRYYLDHTVSTLIAKARGVAQVNINMTILKGLEIPLPPASEQRRIASILDQVEAIKRIEMMRIATLDELFGSLRHRAFLGQL